MKTTLLFLILTFSLFSKAQTWCPPGAVWHHTLTPYYHLSRTGVVEDRYVGDTLLGGKVCKKIRETFTGKVSAMDVVSSKSTMIYSYLENGVMFLYANGVFDTIVNFNASIGDTWLRNRFFGPNCNARRLVTVTDTGRKVINNMNLKWISTTYTGTYSSTGPGGNVSPIIVNDTIIERIMTTYDYLFPMYCEMNHPHGLDMLRRGELICYQDDKFGSYKNAGYESCEYITSVSEIADNDNGISLYPNPVVSTLNIQIKKNSRYTLQITDLPGKQLFEATVEGGIHELHLSHLDKGIYFLKVSNNDGLLLNQKMIKD